MRETWGVQNPPIRQLNHRVFACPSLSPAPKETARLN
jgi:hypothetical protein